VSYTIKPGNGAVLESVYTVMLVKCGLARVKLLVKRDANAVTVCSDTCIKIIATSTGKRG